MTTLNTPLQESTPTLTVPDVTWQQAFRTLGLYTAISLTLSVAGVLIALPLYGMLTSVIPMPKGVKIITPGLIEIVGAIVYDVAGSLIGLLFQYAVIHFVATRTLGGKGTYRGLVHRLTQVLIIQTIVGSVIAVGMSLLLAPAMTLSQRNSEAVISYATAAFIPGVVLIVGISIGFFIWQWRRLNQNYGLTSGRGCMVLILSFILMLALNIALSSVFAAFTNLNTNR